METVEASGSSEHHVTLLCLQMLLISTMRMPVQLMATRLGKKQDHCPLVPHDLTVGVGLWSRVLLGRDAELRRSTGQVG